MGFFLLFFEMNLELKFNSNENENVTNSSVWFGYCLNCDKKVKSTCPPACIPFMNEGNFSNIHAVQVRLRNQFHAFNPIW